MNNNTRQLPSIRLFSRAAPSSFASSVGPFVLVILAVLLASCATSVPIKVDHPARINMGSIRTLGIQPFMGRSPNYSVVVPDGIAPGFRYYDRDRNIGLYVSDAIRHALAKSGRYTIVDMTSFRPSSTFKPDAYITGEILDYSISNSLAVDIRTDKSGMKFKYWITRKEVRLRFVYSVIEYDTGRVIDRIYKEGQASDQAERNDFIFVSFDDYALIQKIMDRIMPEIEKELMPWSETIYLSFEMDKNNPQYKTADGLVNNKQYQRAYEIYSELYRGRGDFKAGYNAALLLFVMDRKEEAIGQMKELADRHDYAKARSTYLWMVEAFEDERKVRNSGI